MLVFDGANDLAALELSSYLPTCDYGLIVFTTRDARIRHPRLATHAVLVGVLTPADALTMLLQRAGVVRISRCFSL